MSTKIINEQIDFFMAPNEIFEVKGISTHEALIYLYLVRCGNNSTAFPSYKTIAEKTFMSRRKAIESVNKLEKLGLISKQIRPKSNNDNESNIYIVKRNNLQLCGESYAPPSESYAPPSAYYAPPLVHNMHHPSESYAPYKELSYKELSYKELNKNIKEEFSEISIEILEHWNSKNITQHKMTKKLDELINKTVKKYSKDTIKLSIDNYNTIIKDDDYFYSYVWTLEIFLKRKKGITEFMNDGCKWLSYTKYNKNNKLVKSNNNQRYTDSNFWDVINDENSNEKNEEKKEEFVL